MDEQEEEIDETKVRVRKQTVEEKMEKGINLEIYYF